MLSTQSVSGADQDAIRVMIVDDSVVIRGLISRWLRVTPGIEVVAAHRHGRAAVDDIEKSDPDIVVLDIEMPEMDGMEALPILLQKCPGLKVIMASTLTKRNASISMKALSMGATDYISKPDSRGVASSDEFRNELVSKVQAIGAKRLRGASAARRVNERSKKPVTAGKAGGQIKLVPFSKTAPRLLAIGSSTGGPQALTHLLRELSPVLSRFPTVITQHMPATFTAILAGNLAKETGRPCKEAEDGEVLKNGAIYVAPGGKHLKLRKGAGTVMLKLDDGPPVNFCKPAVDPMFDSIAPIFGPSALAVVLTGMGHDGANGSITIRQAGGSIIAQDEASSVVWGMPGATAQAGVCSEVLPLEKISNKIKEIVGRGA